VPQPPSGGPSLGVVFTATAVFLSVASNAFSSSRKGLDAPGPAPATLWNASRDARPGRAPPGRAYRPTRAEQETTIRWDREGEEVHVWSASPVTWRRLARLGIRPIRETPVSGRGYRIPVSRFRWGLKRVGVRAPGRRVAVRNMT
jgi:hypothetical protein